MSLTSRWRYQVFLSFRGEDTRKSFISHLYDKLTTKGVYTFKDDRELERGKSISHEIVEAIRDSRIAVVVMSENYADSGWCLDELVEISRCRAELGQIVIPVFYKVDPSDVSEQRSCFASAFEEHERSLGEEREKIRGWREALTEVASVSGWHYQDSEEASFIGQVVADVLDKVSCATSIDPSELIGMDSHVREMEKLLSVDANVGRFVGVWGKGGIGKTTTARVVYDKVCKGFAASWFLENVGSKFRKHGAAAVKEELLTNILKERDLKGWPVDKHSTVIKDRLGKRDVLIVFDNVDHVEQLDVLAKSTDWFGPGSRIIVTTRDKKVLDAHGIRFVYEIKNLDKDAALQLFSRYAFKQNNPKNDYSELSYDFVTYTEGLPLALKILGSSLYNRNLRQWQEQLHMLRDYPNPELFNILRLSYDALRENEKEVFLDIACFFNGEDKDRVGDILDACGFSPETAFEVLKEKALLNVLHNNLYIDELLRDMAVQIIRQESELLAEHSRFWEPEHIEHILSGCLGTEKVKGIFLETSPSKSKEMQLSGKAFKRMINLRLLKMNNRKASENNCNLLLLDHGFEYLSDKLRYLHWHAFPSKKWVPGFSAENLVELELPYSNIEQLWGGKQDLNNLKSINLSHSKLKTLPDLSKAKRLKVLQLCGCDNLVEVLSIQHLTELERLDLSNCSNFRQLSELPRSIKYLNLEGTAIEELPQSLGFLTKCERLDLRNCSRLQSLPRSIIMLGSLLSCDIAGSKSLLMKLSSMKCSPDSPLVHFPDDAARGASNEEPSPTVTVSHKLGSKRTKEAEDPNAVATPMRQCIRHRASNAIPLKESPVLQKGNEKESNIKDYLSKEEVVNKSIIFPPLFDTCKTIEVEAPLTPAIMSETSVFEFQISASNWTSSACESKIFAQSAPNVVENLLAKLEGRNGTKVGRLNGDIKKELGPYFDMSLEEIHNARAFSNIHQIALMWSQHSSFFPAVDHVLSRIQKFKATIPDTICRMNAAQAQKASIPEKSKELDATLDKGKEQLSMLHGKHSNILNEQAKVDAELQRLMARKRELVKEKRSVAVQLERVVEKLSKDLEQRDHLQAEIRRADDVLFEGEEKLAQANTVWKLLRDRMNSATAF